MVLKLNYLKLPQLKGVFSSLFISILVTGVPKSWKFSIVSPVSKKQSVGKPEDFQPIALTSILCKTMKKALVDLLTTTVASALDPLQFAYKSNRSTDGAMPTLLTQQLTLPKGYVRVLFIDFSAAFNSTKVHILLKRLADLNVDESLILWIRDSLSCRPQRVCVIGALSGEITMSTGCPEGSVLSPLLFSLFTNEFALHECHFKFIKYADDMSSVGLLQMNDSLLFCLH